MAELYPDVSHYHPVSDWSKAKKNCGFLISKATQGTTVVDSTLDSFISGCESSGIPYWLYAYLDSGNEKAQAEYLVKTCKNKIGSCFVGYVLDVEAGNNAADVKSALDYLDGQNVKSMIYTNYSKYDTYKSVITGRSANCAFWEARYGNNDGSYSSKYPCHDTADLHQYTSVGSCDGISGNCDLNRITGNKAATWFKNPIKSVDTLAEEVIDGKWGNGDARKTALTEAGYDYNAVQAKVNEKIGTAAPTYTVGTKYTTQTALNVRKGAGTQYALVGYNGLTEDGKKHDKDKNGSLDSGTQVTCKATKKDGSDIWMQIPSGWIAAYYQGNVWVK